MRPRGALVSKVQSAYSVEKLCPQIKDFSILPKKLSALQQAKSLKNMVRRVLDNWPMEEFMQYHSLAFSFCTETEDHQEGARAFVEKRESVFRGK